MTGLLRWLRRVAVPIVAVLVLALAPSGGWLAARARVERYANQLDPGLRVGEVMRFVNHYYAEVQTAAGVGVTEVLVDSASGAVSTELGPAMRWNTSYGLAGGPAAPSSGAELTAAQASEAAQRWLRQADRDVIVDAAEALPTRYGTPAGGRETVAAALAGEAELAVRDSGQGIPSDQVPRVFERFYRVDAGRLRTRGGLGVGLAIARAPVEAHGGLIRAQTAGRYRGAVFMVTPPKGGS